MQTSMKLEGHQQLVLKTYTKLMRCTDTVTTRMHQHLIKHRLTVSQFAVLEVLYSLGPLCQRDIGKKILKTGGNITMVIDNLEKRMLVKRERDDKDRRYITVTLTEKGRQLIREIFPVHLESAEDVFSALTTAELEELGRLLKKLGISAANPAEE